MTGLWSVVVAEGTTNLVTNPSGELGTTGFGINGVGTTLARSSAQRRRGSYSVAVTPSSDGMAGALYALGTLTAFQVYCAGVDVWGAAGIPYRVQFANAAYQLGGTPALFTGDGAWHRHFAYYTAAATEAHYLYILKDGHASAATFYVDGLQCEAKSYATTYCDGREPGCYWTGAADASMSARYASRRLGGRVRNLDDYSFFIESATGIDAPPVRNYVSAYARLPGGLHEHTRLDARPFVLTGLVQGTSIANLKARKEALYNVLKPDPTNDDPVILQYAGGGQPTQIKAYYDGGLEGGRLEGFNERVAVRFVAPNPEWEPVLT